MCVCEWGQGWWKHEAQLTPQPETASFRRPSFSPSFSGFLSQFWRGVVWKLSSLGGLSDWLWLL